MIRQYPQWGKIPDETVLWQYMSLTKFLFLIKNRKLHLHRIDDLMDKEEGILSVLDKKSLPFYDDTCCNRIGRSLVYVSQMKMGLVV